MRTKRRRPSTNSMVGEGRVHCLFVMFALRASYRSDSRLIVGVFTVNLSVQGGRWMGGTSWFSSPSTAQMLKECRNLPHLFVRVSIALSLVESVSRCVVVLVWLVSDVLLTAVMEFLIL